MLTPAGLALLCMGAGDSADDFDEDYFGVRMYWSHYDLETNLKMLEECGFKILWSRIVVDSHPGSSHLFVLVQKPGSEYRMGESVLIDKERLPDPAWLAQTYGIRWAGLFQTLGGKSAKVVLIRDERTDQPLVLRTSEPARIDAARLSQVHRFLKRLSECGVRTPLPTRTCGGRTYAVHRESGRLVEVFPYVKGRPPQIGNIADAQRVATALARLHNVGLDYEDLPDEESCDQNHVALERLRVDVGKALAASKGKVFEALLHEYVSDVEALIASLQALRPDLVHTGLHLDVGPNNILFAEDGDVWFIDCSHAARGRRIFDVVTAAYYMDQSCHTKPGDPRRYQDVDPALESAFLAAYRSTCEPAWRDAETEAWALERRLMLVHGAACWATECSEAHAMQQLTGFRRLRERLAKNEAGHNF